MGLCPGAALLGRPGLLRSGLASAEGAGDGIAHPGESDVDEQRRIGAVRGYPLMRVGLVAPGMLRFAVLPEPLEAPLAGVSGGICRKCSVRLNRGFLVDGSISRSSFISSTRMRR